MEATDRSLIWSRTRKFQVFVFIPFLGTLTGCDIPQRPEQHIISHAPVFRPASPTEINTVEQALAAIITVGRDDIGLPVVDPLYVKLYKNSSSFAFYGHDWRVLPLDVANEAAVARDNEIHIDFQKIRRGTWGALLRFLAHEYGHAVHYEIARPPRAESFVAEGFADWVAAKVLHFLRWQDYSTTVDRSKREVVRQRDALADVSLLQDNRFWRRTLGQANGFTRTYTVAFLAMDRLIRQRGLATVIQYLRDGDPGRNFIMSLNEIAIDLGKVPLKTISPRKDTFTINRPEWKIGDKWTYLKTNFGSVTTVIKEVIGEDTYQGKPVFVLKTTEEETLYGKEGLGFAASRKNGKIILDVDQSQPFFSWPLEPGKESRASFTERNLVENTSAGHSRLRVVTGIEQIHVPAGDFSAIKIESYERSDGHLLAEYWYSPTIKWFVKTRNYSEIGFTEEALLQVELQR
jgi:hypothetical protein